MLFDVSPPFFRLNIVIINQCTIDATSLSAESNKHKFIFIAYKNDHLFPSKTLITDNLSVGGVIISASIIEGTNRTDLIEIDEPVVIENALDPNITNNDDSNVSSNQRVRY